MTRNSSTQPRRYLLAALLAAIIGACPLYRLRSMRTVTMSGLFIDELVQETRLRRGTT